MLLLDVPRTRPASVRLRQSSGRLRACRRARPCRRTLTTSGSAVPIAARLSTRPSHSGSTGACPDVASTIATSTPSSGESSEALRRAIDGPAASVALIEVPSQQSATTSSTRPRSMILSIPGRPDRHVVTTPYGTPAAPARIWSPSSSRLADRRAGGRLESCSHRGTIPAILLVGTVRTVGRNPRGPLPPSGDRRYRARGRGLAAYPRRCAPRRSTATTRPALGRAIKPGGSICCAAAAADSGWPRKAAR